MPSTGFTTTRWTRYCPEIDPSTQILYNSGMKANIHPQYYPQAQVTCACGNTFTTGSTKPTIRVEICAKCHPFFTGSQRFVDTVGKIEKFQAKQKSAAAKQAVVKQKKEEKRQEENRPKTLREMLQGAR